MTHARAVGAIRARKGTTLGEGNAQLLGSFGGTLADTLPSEPVKVLNFAAIDIPNGSLLMLETIGDDYHVISADCSGKP